MVSSASTIGSCQPSEAVSVPKPRRLDVLALRNPHRVRRRALASTSCGLGGVPATRCRFGLLATPLRYYSPRFLQATAGWMYGPVENPDGRLMRLDLKRATLSEVRRAVGLTQKQLAQTLGMEKGDLSKLERHQNLHLATLTRFIEATGGRLRITAVYGDSEVALDINDVAPSRDTDVRP